MIHLADPVGANRHWYSSKPYIDDGATKAERARLERVVDGDIDSPRTAALAMIADALRIIALAEPENVLGECGEAAWIVEECVDYLRLVRYRFDMVAAAGRSGTGA